MLEKMSRNLTSRIRNLGFSGLELIIVLCILSAVISIAVPTLSPFVSGRKLNKEARLLYSFFKKARMEAVKRSCNVSLSFSGKRVVVMADSGDLLVDYTFSPQVSIAWTFTDSTNSIGFNNMGIAIDGTSQPGSAGGKVILSGNSGKSYQIQIRASGRVSLL